jgi:hypothetical protein
LKKIVYRIWFCASYKLYNYLKSSNFFDQVISRLISNIRILLQEDGVLGDLVGNLIVGILGVLNTEGQVIMEGTCWGSFWITITMRGGVIRGGKIGNWMVGRGDRVCGKSQGEGDHQGGNLNKENIWNFKSWN